MNDLDRAIFDLEFAALMLACGRQDEAGGAYGRALATLRRMRAAEDEHQPEDRPRAEEEEPGSARWRAERRWLSAEAADELDLY